MTSQKPTATAPKPGTTTPPAGTALATREPPKLELTGSGMSEGAKAFLAELGPTKREVPATLPLITIDHKETLYNLPSAEKVPEVSGYPITIFQTRKYYDKPYRPGDKSPPDCHSSDMKAPSPGSPSPQAKTCAECPQNRFGTGKDGRSMACGTSTWVVLVNPAFGQPPLQILITPSSSISTLMGNRMKAGYFGRCIAKYGLYETVWTTFGLQRGGEGTPHCVVVPQMGPNVADTDVDQAKQLARLRNQFNEAIIRMQGNVAEIHDEGDDS